jgi:hypothetical protein
MGLVSYRLPTINLSIRSLVTTIRREKLLHDQMAGGAG